VKDVELGDRKQEEKVESGEKTEADADVDAEEAHAESKKEAKVVEEAEPAVAPESVPLPEEVSGELDDSSSIPLRM
jgi:hypothetical protein